MKSQSIENSQNQVVPCNLGVSPSIWAFTIECAHCSKWRLIPSKKEYEKIRENILKLPFFCETGRKWRPDISCDDPPDITQDGSRLWATDSPNIPVPPPGWQRLLQLRNNQTTRYADVYYFPPSREKKCRGTGIRSKVEVASFLEKHPEYAEQGIDLSRFSFKIPKPLQVSRVTPTTDAGDREMIILSLPSQGARPDADTNSRPCDSYSPNSSDESHLSLQNPDADLNSRSHDSYSPDLSYERHLPLKKRYRLNGGVSTDFES